MTSTPARDAIADVDPDTARPARTSAGTLDDPLEAGSFGRDVAGHPLVLLYANVPALIMPTLHPKIAHVLSEKDRALNGSEDLPTLQAASRRLISTYEMVMGIVFAGPEADDVAHGLHELHRPIAGSMPDGTSYHAWNKDVWNWTWGSILKGGLDIADEFGLFADADEREQAYRALNEVGRRFGVRSLPDTYDGFCAYWQPIVYGIGQIMHISGLAYSGGYGVLRKTPGEISNISLSVKAALGFMGLGGVIAIIGGLMFVVVLARAMWGKHG